MLAGRRAQATDAIDQSALELPALAGRVGDARPLAERVVLGLGLDPAGSVSLTTRPAWSRSIVQRLPSTSTARLAAELVTLEPDRVAVGEPDADHVLLVVEHEVGRRAVGRDDPVGQAGGVVLEARSTAPS